MAYAGISDLQVVEAARDFHEYDCTDAQGRVMFATHILNLRTGQSIEDCLDAMERAASRGYLECGVSLRTARPSDKGRKLLEEAELAAVNDGKRPGERPAKVFLKGIGAFGHRPVSPEGHAVRDKVREPSGPAPGPRSS